MGVAAEATRGSRNIPRDNGKSSAICQENVMEPPRRYTRRDALGVLASGGAFGLSRAHLGARAGQSASVDGGQFAIGRPIDTLLAAAVERNDTAVQSLLADAGH